MNLKLYPVLKDGKNAIHHYYDGQSLGILSFGDCGKAFYLEQYMDESNEFIAWASYGQCDEYDIEYGTFNGMMVDFLPKEVELYQLDSK